MRVIYAVIICYISILLPQEVHLKITDRGTERIRIAIMPFVLDSTSQAIDTDLGNNIAQIITDDLAFSTFFTVLNFDFFPTIVRSESEIIKVDWLNSGVQAIVLGNFKKIGVELQIEARLFSVGANRSIYKRNIRGSPDDLRHMVHSISDDIVKALTGEKGIAQTKIAFISKRTGNKELYTCDYDGYNISQISSGGHISLTPDWSPDLSSLTFTSFRFGNPDLFIYNFETGKTEIFSRFNGLNAAAAYSPDGRKIAIALSKDGNSEIYIIDTRTKSLKRLTHNYNIETSPSWSPDGHYLAFTSDRSGTPQVYIMDEDGANVRRLTFEGDYNDQPSWSPRGDKIAYASRTRGQFDIAVIDVSGENITYLTSIGNNEDPDWAPDGYHIVFSSDRLGAYQLYEMLYDGSQIRRITNSVSDNVSPAWSPLFKWGK